MYIASHNCRCGSWYCDISPYHLIARAPVHLCARTHQFVQLVEGVGTWAIWQFLRQLTIWHGQDCQNPLWKMQTRELLQQGVPGAIQRCQGPDGVFLWEIPDLRPPQNSGVLLSHTGRSTQHCSVKPFQALKIDQNTSWLRPCEAQHWKKHKLVCRPASTSETQFSQLSSETEISIGEALAAQHDTGEVRVINRGNGDKLGSKMSI